MTVQYVGGIPCIDAAGKLRKLAAFKPAVADKDHFKLKQFSAMRAVDPSQWKACDLSSFKSPIRDQATHGSCTGHAGVAALDIVRRQAGDEPVLLSCTFPYSLVNGGRDNGASVSSVLKVLEQVGTCTFAECGTDQIFQNQYPQSCFETAKKYKAVQAFMCNSFEELCEAVNQGFPVAFGIEIGQNFSRLSDDGVCPPPMTVIGGHALCGIGLKQSRTGTWLIKFQNSWTAQWGLGGYAFLSKGSFDNYVDGYAIMYAEADNPPPPVVKEAKKLVISLAPPEPIPVPPQPPKEEPAKEETVTVVPKTESLAAELEATPSMTHTDPEGVLAAPPRRRRK